MVVLHFTNPGRTAADGLAARLAMLNYWGIKLNDEQHFEQASAPWQHLMLVLAF